jgi:Ca-activated chloride channel family protein
MNTDDPKFTAHALGELEDLTPAERAEIEALINDDTHAAAEASETRKLATRLREELQAEATQPLTAAQRAKVLAAMHSVALPKTPKVIPFWRRSTVLSAIAACLIVGLFISMIHFAMEKDRKSHYGDVARSSYGEGDVSVPIPDGIEVPQDMVAEVAQASVAASSPNLDVRSTSASSASFKMAPVQVGVNISTAPANPAPNISLNPTQAPAVGMGLSKGQAARIGEFRGHWSKGGKAMGQPSSQSRAGISPVTTTGALESTVTRDYASFDTGKSAPPNTESFDEITDNPFLPVRENPLSTFSTDVDTASYAIVRRFLNEQRLPPKVAVRIEELLNYFTYDYPQPKGDAPFSATMEVATCPWTPAHRLVRIGLKGREIAKDKRPASNLVFLLDVSGSMQPANRLPLLKQSLGLLIDQLGAEDRVAMVVYAGSSGCVLESTSDKAEMRLALGRLEAGGSTNGGSGIQLAYDIARKNFIKGGTNRVILGTDGDWNVGITNHESLFELITQQAKSGVFLTALGFGMGNLKDAMLVKLADKGNGNYGYIDTLLEAKKLLVDQLSGTLVTISKDVKIQVEFNPAQVSGYRLIGYEKRLLAKEDFNDDKKDAGEIGAGHTVTALYEVVPAGKELPKAATVDPLKYQGTSAEKSDAAEKSAIRNPQSAISPELLTLKLRYKAPDGDTSKLLEFPLTDTGATFEKSTRDFRFAAAVAGYGMLLRDSPHKGNATWDSIRELAMEGKGDDANGYRAEFVSLLEKAQALMR